MSPLRLQGATSGYAELAASAAAGDVVLTIPNAAGTLDRINRAGNILQVVNATYSTQVFMGSSTFADTGLTATITPTLTSSKILVFVNQAGCAKETSNTRLFLRLVRGSTTISDFERIGGYTNSTAANFIGSCSVCYLDSPATTSATIYKTQFASEAGTANVFVQAQSSTSTITLMEVAA
jgi:hypothetical protein